MSWLSSPKVRLALIVNGLYFISLFTPTTPHTRPRLFAHTRGSHPVRRQVPPRPEHIPIAPPSAPSSASAYVSGGMLHLSLNNDLTLVRRPGYTLLLSPSFSAPTYPPAEPEAARLNFLRYSNSNSGPCPGDCPLTIKADGGILWPRPSAGDSGGDSYSWKRESVPHSSIKMEDGSVVETLAAESFTAEVPYDTFLDIISARRVSVRLGPDWVELTADQIEALRDMHRRLPQPPPDDAGSY
jgi:hypothetical protein